jgi:integrase
MPKRQRQYLVLGTYVSKALRERLIQAAHRKGVSLSAEMQNRLQASIDAENPDEETVAEKVEPPPIDNSKKTAELQTAITKLETENAQLREIVSSQQPSGLTGKLSTAKIAKLISDIKAGKLKTKEGKLKSSGWFGDSGNLYLQISKNGDWVSWIFRYDRRRFGGPRDQPMGLGSYPDRTLDMARSLALKYRLMLKATPPQDPMAARGDAKSEEKRKRGLAKTISEVADEFFEAKFALKSTSFRDRATHCLNVYVHEPIGKWPIQKVDRKTILDDLYTNDEGQRRGLRELWIKKHTVGTELRSHLDRIFRFAISNDYYRGKNPAQWKDELEHVLPPSGDVHKKEHYRSLNYRRASWFIQVLRTFKYAERHSKWAKLDPVPARALEFLVLTGARPSEVTEARWGEFNFEEKTWTVPWQHLKEGSNHRTDLSRPITKSMLAVLNKMKKLHISQSLDAVVFPSFYHHKNTKPLNRNVLGNFLRRTLKLKLDITAHGFRSTLSDWRRAKRYPKEWYQIQVDHAFGDQMEDTYGPDKLLDERREMMEAYDTYLCTPAPDPAATAPAPESTTDNVVDMTEKRRRANARH